MEAVNEIILIRSVGKVVGTKCSNCQKLAKESDFMLLIKMSSLEFALCVHCEGNLLERLITNYVKRLKRGSKVGFLGCIEKDMGPVREDGNSD